MKRNKIAHECCRSSLNSKSDELREYDDSDDELYECDNGHGCQHYCHIVNDQAICSCKDEYVLNKDGHTCNTLNDETVPPNELKICNAGYSIDSTGHCNDIDECKIENNACNGTMICENTIGSYYCKIKPLTICRLGYVFDRIKLKCFRK